MGNQTDRNPVPSAGVSVMSVRRVAVLYGGISEERAVSLVSGQQVVAALREAGYEVTPVEVRTDLRDTIAALTPAPDVVFNALHGRFGEDGAIQGVLDWLGIPYTHSGVRASAIAMDKAAARTAFLAAGLPVAEGRLVTVEELAEQDPLPRPFVIKPANEGSAVGVHILHEGDNRRTEIAHRWSFGGQALVEEYIPGRELTVGVLNDRALTVTDIRPRSAFYDYESKYAEGGSRHILPAQMHPDAFQKALDVALAAHHALGCRGATRSDFRYDDTRGEPGRLVLLEVNTQPGLTPTSLLPEQAALMGMDFVSLCRWMVEEATCRA
ncbi:D-alanine--D-alanine ligase [Granulibacter bethesdensis]|nr:D-alanine--D-alanine ligase [Granulibacter bethesdensis]